MNELRDLIQSKSFCLEDSILITSETRSGSTWLMELLSNIPFTVINWEPLHPRFGVVPDEYKWGNRPFIPESSTPDEFLTLIKEILTLKRNTDWTLSFCYINRAVTANRVITKCVRANLLLPWLTSNIRFKHKPVLLLRHPISVAISQLETFKNEKRELQNFQIPDWINNERFTENLGFIAGLATRLEKKVALWCINHLTTIRHPEHGKRWLVVYYEDLLLDPAGELQRILSELNLDIEEALMDNINFRKPSATKFKDQFEEDPVRQLEKWQGLLTQEEKNNMQKIFDHFNISEYSAFQNGPIRTNTV